MTDRKPDVPLRILMVEDSPDDAELNLRELRKGGFQVEPRRVETAGAMIEALHEQPWDCVLSDFKLPAFGGFEALRTLQAFGQDLPFILVSGAIGEEIAVAAMKAGAHDYVLKGNLARLCPALERELKEAANRREKRQAELALKDSQARYLDLFEHSPNPIWVEDFSGVKALFDEYRQRGVQDFRAHFANHPAELLRCATAVRILEISESSLPFFGIQTKEDIPDYLPRFMDEASWSVFREELATLAEGGTRFRSEILIRDLKGERKIVSLDLSVSPGFEASLERVLVAFVDVTHRVEMETRLLESHRRLEQAQRIANLGSWEWDFTQDTPIWSPQMFEIFGLQPSAKAPTYDQFVSWIHPQDRAEVLGARKEVISSGRSCNLEFRIQHPNGSIRHIQERAELVLDDQARPFRLRATLQDITERRRMEEMLKDMENLSARGQMAAYIAHEINNPLAGIKNAFALVERAIPADHSYAKYADLIKREIDRIAGIIRTMYHVYRPPTLERKAISLQQAFLDIENLVESKCRAADVHLRTVMQDPDDCVMINEGLLRQVLFNLVLNAIDASPVGGTITLKSAKPPGACLVSVEDEGTGIPEEFAEQVFQPGFTTKRDSTMSGLGLGLATCRSILESLGGTLTFRVPESGLGTRFEAMLPQGGEPEDGRSVQL